MMHYLLSVASTAGVYVHTYLMTDQKRLVEQAGCRMLDELEKRDMPAIPLILATRLAPDGIETVRTVLFKEMPQAEEYCRKATNFHISMWLMNKDNPEMQKLMKLH